MSNESSDSSGSSGPVESDGRLGIRVPLPVRDGDLFKHGATSHVLQFLADNPDFSVSLRQLARVVQYTERSIRESVDVLETNDLVTAVPDGNARRVQINRDLLTTAEDPILSILQTEFQVPVRLAVQSLEGELEGVEGILLFGSVARGEADRQSDIDLWVLVKDDVVEQQHVANKLGKDLSNRRIPTAVALDDATVAQNSDSRGLLRERLENEGQESSAGQRYSFEFIVETPASFLNQLDSVDRTLFTESITLRDSETLQRLKREVLERD